NLLEEIAYRKKVTPEVSFDLEDEEYPAIREQIALRGWRRLASPRTKISRLLIQEFYANAVQTDKEVEQAEQHPYKSYVRGVEVNFSPENIWIFLRFKKQTPEAEMDYATRQRTDQRLDEVLSDICIPGATWKLGSGQPAQPIQLRRAELTPLARGWHEFIIHSIILTGNRVKDVRAEELIVDNIAVIAQGMQGKGKLAFPSTIYKLCKDAQVPLHEFRRTDLIPQDKPIIARLMETTRLGRNVQQPEVGFQQNSWEQQQQGFHLINEQLAGMQLQQQQFFENMQNTQAQYLEELKTVKARQDELWNNTNKFHDQIRKEQDMIAREIQEVKKFQVNQTLMGFQKEAVEKLEQTMGV
ncbi:hypothetical protein PIB30_084430, partial [Stylosanthes scabra]|nr:hypothetical protein [Stylosanthes scabra]